jgi:hypothetical protein
MWVIPFAVDVGSTSVNHSTSGVEKRYTIRRVTKTCRGVEQQQNSAGFRLCVRVLVLTAVN